jgi:hypothetical protein
VALALHVGGRHVPLRVEHRHPSRGSARRPAAASTSVTGASGARNSQNSPMPPEKQEALLGRPRRPVLPALVAHHEFESGHEETRLAGPGDRARRRQTGLRQEDLPVGPVADAGAGDATPRLADDPELAALDVRRERRVHARPLGAVGEDPGLAPVEAHRVGLAAPVDLDVEPLGQGVDHGRADPVQTAGRRVAAAAELAARVELGEDHLDPGEAGAGLDVDRDAAAVVAHLDGAVVVQHDIDVGAVLPQRLVDGVVDDLPQAVHEAAAVGGPDVHPRSLAHRLEALEHLEVACAVATRRVGRRRDGHRCRPFCR